MRGVAQAQGLAGLTLGPALAVDNPEHGGVPRNFRPKQPNPDLDPRVTSSLLCDLSIVANVSAAMNDCEEGDCVRDR